MARVDYNAMAGRYDAGRAVPLDALQPWRAALEPYVPAGVTILDVGSGTGIFCEAFARWFGARVIGVEPSAGMRAQAVQGRPHPLVQYVAGTAERLPVRRGSCRVAWLSTVIHHLASLEASAHELRHALTPNNGVVLVRSAFPDRLDHITLFRYFPGARAIAETFPSVEATAEAFAAAGFAVRALDRVDQHWAPSLRAYAKRVRLRADSTLAPLSEGEFSEGLRRLDLDVAREESPSPVVDGLDLLVLARRA
jgi:ubiquinone/menaquinone biosynthesis C-methylase UbiE